MESSKSNSEDFRGVIDDLTVQNKKLRQKLRKYERLHCSHLQGDKLFEVRIHGLPAHKKRELEETLRNFASSLQESPGDTTFRTRPHGITSPPAAASSFKFSESSTSLSKPIDSAYASMSMSGQTSNSNSRVQDQGNVERHAKAAHSKRQNIRSYLHDIPENQLQKLSLAMSEKTKRKLVVQRLEQIFTGKGAAPGQDSQSIQQQEVSQSAATADRNATEARGTEVGVEGVREARILPAELTFLPENLSEIRLRSQSRDTKSVDDSISRATYTSSDGTPDQRPTRPIDLDLCRAQVPADNIQYIRHLGLPPPKGSPELHFEAGDDWTYLNLLMSMAQLHTINVTPEFVRKAVAEISTKFEISEDGRKIRWRGGIHGTQMSSDSGSNSGQDSGCSPAESNFSRFETTVQSGSNQIAHQSNIKSNGEHGVGGRRRPVPLGQLFATHRSQFKSLFFHHERSETEEEGYVHDDESLLSSGPAEDVGTVLDASGIRSSGMRPKSLHQTKENGPIIFYNGAKFCTDLSGDVTGGRFEDTAYALYTHDAVGNSRLSRPLENLDCGSVKEALAEAQTLSEQWKTDSDGEEMKESCFQLEDLRTSPMDKALSRLSPKHLEASGISGVLPEDNFAINVVVRQTALNKGSLPQLSGFPGRSTDIDRMFRKSSQTSIYTPHGLQSWPVSDDRQRGVKCEVISVTVTNLPPSLLPPPSYICLPFSSTESDNDISNDTSASAGPIDAMSGLTRDSEDLKTPMLFEVGKGRSYATSDNQSDDSSIDLLAHAREFDPETIAAREREFDSNMRQQFTEEIPAGSSAATVGGGSGFLSESERSSPTTGMEEDSRPRLKRARSDTDGTSVPILNAKIPRLENG